MPNRIHRDQPCVDCGELVLKQTDRQRPVYCAPCGTRRAIDAAQQMAAKSGPVWDAWLTSRGPMGGHTNET